jgi:hypothetical protein
MAQYRFLTDHYIGTTYILAGTTASTADAIGGGTLPINFRPSGNCEPLDTPAVNAFYAQGPQLLGLVRPQWATIPVNAPVTYWRGTPLPAVPGANAGTSWQLTGLGANLPAIVI